MQKQFSVLLIEDDIHDVEVIERAFDSISPPIFDLHHVTRFLDGVKKLNERSFEVILLDLGLPDSAGLRGLERLMALVPQTPVIVMTGLKDEAMALRAIELGAQEFLDKSGITSETIIRSIRYAAKRTQQFHSRIAKRTSSSVSGKLLALVDDTATSILIHTRDLETTSLTEKQNSVVSKIRDRAERSTRLAKQLCGDEGPDFMPVSDASEGTG